MDRFQVAKSLYAYDWGIKTGNFRDSRWDYEEKDVHDYWLDLADIILSKWIVEEKDKSLKIVGYR